MTTPPPKRNSIQTWRAASKQPVAQTDVSRIFAEPQQFVPSTSATALLESKLPPPSELLETTEETRRQKRERDPLPPNQTVAADDVAPGQGGSSAAAPPLERQYSNKRVKRSADISESTDSTIRRKNSAMPVAWFGQRGRQRPPRPNSVFERVESDGASIQNSSSVNPQPSEISQPTPASTSTLQTQVTNNTTPVASGSQENPILIPPNAATGLKNTPSGSPGWFGTLRRAPQPAKEQDPQPPTTTEVVSESIHLDLDLPPTLPAPQEPLSSSKPPTRTGWFSKSVTSTPTPVQQPLPDQPTPPSPIPSLRIIEAPPTSSSVEPAAAALIVDTAAARYRFNIPLLGRPKLKAQEVVVVEDLGTPPRLQNFY